MLASGCYNDIPQAQWATCSTQRTCSWCISQPASQPAIKMPFCIVELFIDCIYNLHMYRTLYQAGMHKTAFKCFLPHVRARAAVSSQPTSQPAASRQPASSQPAARHSDVFIVPALHGGNWLLGVSVPKRRTLISPVAVVIPEYVLRRKVTHAENTHTHADMKQRSPRRWRTDNNVVPS